jgi:hypothetical protein
LLDVGRRLTIAPIFRDSGPKVSRMDADSLGRPENREGGSPNKSRMWTVSTMMQRCYALTTPLINALFDATAGALSAM